MPEAENVNRYIIYKPTRKYNEFANKVKCSATSEMHMIFEAWLVHRKGEFIIFQSKLDWDAEVLQLMHLTSC